MIIDLSVKLKQLRLDKKLRQDQVAALIGVEKSSISMYENDMRQPTYETLIRYANLFNVSTDYLLGRTDNRTLDLSGLTTAEASMICDLVANMTAKNRKLEDLR